MRGFFFEACRVGDHVGGLGEHLLVDVAERDDLDRRDLDQPEQVALAVPAGADQADALAGICQLLRVGRHARQRQSGGTTGDEVTSVHARHYTRGENEVSHEGTKINPVNNSRSGLDSYRLTASTSPPRYAWVVVGCSCRSRS